MSVTNLGEKNSAYAYVIIVNSLNIYIWFEEIRTYHSPLWWTKTSWSDWKKVYRWPVTRPDSDSDMTRARTWLGEWIHSACDLKYLFDMKIAEQQLLLHIVCQRRKRLQLVSENNN